MAAAAPDGVLPRTSLSLVVDDTDQKTATTEGSALEPASAKEKENDEYISGIKLTVVLASVTLVVFLILLDISIIGTAIPQITSDLDSLPDVGWYAGAYQLARCVATVHGVLGEEEACSIVLTVAPTQCGTSTPHREDLHQLQG